jgi:hypothetical protein
MSRCVRGRGGSGGGDGGVADAHEPQQQHAVGERQRDLVRLADFRGCADGREQERLIRHGFEVQPVREHHGGEVAA